MGNTARTDDGYVAVIGTMSARRNNDPLCQASFRGIGAENSVYRSTHSRSYGESSSNASEIRRRTERRHLGVERENGGA
ncbi:hypothetical protein CHINAEXTREME_20025 [Halobiforma lacisalsi AJ5]|uniref:Uncharacterized protein n=1 Tax=Natronobacterium lacisalsi AJ5 TaxID=358396 RepID=M0LQX8_NATLA|nr:hypothetical protein CHINAEXTREME_20025 [Halobiforma lacisalsi AJ5]EMA35896.1 hypothetical protein C445_03533 [Halobiforma lacisalsi AJ5]